MEIEFFLQARGDLLNVAGGDGAGPSEPATSQFSMNGCEARRDAAGIRLNVEAVPDAPNRDRGTGRDPDKSHVRNQPIMHPMAKESSWMGPLRSCSGVRACPAAGRHRAL